MRLLPLLTLATLVLAGCTTPGGDGGDGGNGSDTCGTPQWIQGGNRLTVQNSWPRTGVRSDPQKNETLGAGSMSFRGLPLDRIEMDFSWKEQNGSQRSRGVFANQGTLTLRLFDADGSPLAAYKDGAAGMPQHEWSWTDTAEANFTLTVQLEEGDATPDPRPVEARWTFNGFPSDPENPEDVAAAWYDATYWYRTCTVGQERVRPDTGTQTATATASLQPQETF